MHDIDTKNLNIRTDLIIEQVKKDNCDVEVIDNVRVSRVCVKKNLDNMSCGNYITLEFDDITNFETRECVGKVLVNEIKKILDKNDIKEDDEVLIIGLGNRMSTPDALGPKVIDSVIITRHLFQLKMDVKNGFRSVCALSLGVMGNTGIETFDIISGVISVIKPKFIIAIDSLCALNVERLNKTIQLTDTGIHPGSGIGNKRRELSKKTLNIPVIALGVPTVVSSSTIVSDTINYLFMHINYMKNNYDVNKLVVKRFDNYLEKIKKMKVDEDEKKYLGGVLGTLNESDKYSLINEVLNSINYNLIVTPKEVDYLIKELSDVISSSLNNVLHKSVNNY